MAELPILLRRVAVADMPDDDWAATQVAPDASICADVSTVRRLGAVIIARDAAGAVASPSGTVNVALVDVAASVALGGLPSRTVVKTTPVDTIIPAGMGLEYNVQGSRLVTIRVDAHALDAGVATIEIWWNCLEQG